MATFTLYLPDRVVAALDERRGERSRSGWIRTAVEVSLGEAPERASRSPTDAGCNRCGLKNREPGYLYCADCLTWQGLTPTTRERSAPADKPKRRTAQKKSVSGTDAALEQTARGALAADALIATEREREGKRFEDVVAPCRTMIKQPRPIVEKRGK